MSSAIKNFFQRRKLDRKFKQAGEGHKLSEATGSFSSSSSSKSNQTEQLKKRVAQGESSLKAAEAALARSLSGSQGKTSRSVSAKGTWKSQIQSSEKKNDGKEAKKSAGIELKSNLAEKGKTEIESAPMLSTILFACPLCPASLPENEIRHHIEECLYKDIASEPSMVAATMIHTLNDKIRVQSCIEVLNRYLDNIIKNPNEEKYRKIRIDNKVFATKLKNIKGVKELLTLAIGFVEVRLPINDDEAEDFYLLSEGLAMETEKLEVIKGYVNEAEPLLPLLDRNVKVYKPLSGGASLEFPSDFFTVSNQEIKREQQQRTEDLEKSKQLRTRAMKEADLQSTKRLYRFTLIRIKFPDDHVLEGTFFSKDLFSEVTSFVKESLQIDWLPFELSDATGKKILAPDATLEGLRLSPAAILNFKWDQGVIEDVNATNTHTNIYLTTELLARVIEQQ